MHLSIHLFPQPQPQPQRQQQPPPLPQQQPLSPHGDSVTSLPIILQGDGHSRTVLGLSGSAANAPRGPELVLSDPKRGVLGEAPRTLDGKSYQLVVVRGDGQRRLDEAEARRRRGVPQAAALWRQGEGRSIGGGSSACGAPACSSAPACAARRGTASRI